MTAGGRRPRATPISCCPPPPRSNATTSAARRAIPSSSPCTAPSIQSARRGTTSIFFARWRSASATRLDFTEDRDEMGWCQWVYDRVRASAAAKGVELPGFQQFWAEGFVELPPPERDFVLFEDFRRDPERHPLEDAVRADRDRVRRGGRLRLCGLPAASGLDRRRRNGSAAPPPQQWPIHLVTHQPAAGCTARWTRDRCRARRRSRGARRSASIRPTRPSAASATAMWCACSTIAAPVSPARVIDRRRDAGRCGHGDRRLVRSGRA